MTDVQASITALKGVGSDFADMATKLRTASEQAAKIDLGKDQLSSLGESEGIIQAYKGVQDFMANILRDGNTALAQTGTAITKSADDYERDEKEGAHEIEKVG